MKTHYFLKTATELGTFERIFYFNNYNGINVFLKRASKYMRPYSVYRQCFTHKNITLLSIPSPQLHL